MEFDTENCLIRNPHHADPPPFKFGGFAPAFVRTSAECNSVHRQLRRWWLLETSATRSYAAFRPGRHRGVGHNFRRLRPTDRVVAVAQLPVRFIGKMANPARNRLAIHLMTGFRGCVWLSTSSEIHFVTRTTSQQFIDLANRGEFCKNLSVACRT